MRKKGGPELKRAQSLFVEHQHVALGSDKGSGLDAAKFALDQLDDVRVPVWIAQGYDDAPIGSQALAKSVQQGLLPRPRDIIKGFGEQNDVELAIALIVLDITHLELDLVIGILAGLGDRLGGNVEAT